MFAAEALFWLSVGLLVYTYFGYPVLAWFRARIRGRPHARLEIKPTVTVVIAAHNEASQITQKIANLRASRYPKHRLEILIGSDGSTDHTVELAQSCAGDGIRLIAFPERRGKPAVLNDLVPMARGEIVVLADARQKFEPEALSALVAPFGSQDIGAVSGELVLVDESGTAVGQGVGSYWHYEKFIRRNESCADSTIGTTGAIYAVRKELFEPIPQDTLLDDVWIPMRTVRRGYRVVFEPEARAYDRSSTTAAEEFRRKVRTMAGLFQLLARETWMFNPFVNRLWFQTLSHKALRLLSPVLMALALGANLLILESLFYACALAAQSLFYALAAGALAFRNTKRRPLVFSVPYVFALVNCAIVIGFIRFLTGRQSVTWRKAYASSAPEF